MDERVVTSEKCRIGIDGETSSSKNPRTLFFVALHTSVCNAVQANAFRIPFDGRTAGVAYPEATRQGNTYSKFDVAHTDSPTEGVYEIVPMQECRQETVGSDLSGHRQVCGSSSQEHSIKVVCKGVLSAQEHTFNETAMYAKALASNRMANSNTASHSPRVRTRERVKR